MPIERNRGPFVRCVGTRQNLQNSRVFCIGACRGRALGTTSAPRTTQHGSNSSHFLRQFTHSLGLVKSCTQDSHRRRLHERRFGVVKCALFCVVPARRVARACPQAWPAAAANTIRAANSRVFGACLGRCASATRPQGWSTQQVPSSGEAPTQLAAGPFLEVLKVGLGVGLRSSRSGAWGPS